jgi:hypothetical protein
MMDRLVALATGWNDNDVRNGDRSSIARERERRPRPSSPCQKLMRPLDVSARELLFQMQVKTNQSER